MSTRRSPSNLQRVLPRFSIPPNAQNGEQLTVEYLTRLVASLQQIINDLSDPGTSRCGNLIIHDCQQHSSDLNVGDVYVDGNGFLKLRQGGSPVVDSLRATGAVSNITVSIT